MSVERQFNWLGQQRVDVPHLRTIDSSNANDFDVTAGQSLAGGQALVVRGFVLITTGAIGLPATSLQLQVDPGLIWHYNASENGTIFQTAAGTAPEVLSSVNPVVSGSFTASQLNYVGLDLQRNSDPSTSDLVEFLDADTLEEEPETVPLARTLNYRIVISTSDFTSQPNVLPIALVTTDASNNVVTIVDARNMAFRLGTGGTTPNVYNAYSWPQGRNESQNSDGFSGGDKAFASLRDAIQAMEARLQELGGGPYWYSPVTDRHVKLIRNLGTRFPTGDNFEVDGSGHLLWQGLAFVFCNAQDLGGQPVDQNSINDQVTELPGLTDIQVGECIYVDVNEQPPGGLGGPLQLQAVKVAMTNLGMPPPPYARWVIAWRTSYGYFTRDSQFGVGTLLAPASTVANGIVTLNQTPFNMTNPVVVVANSAGAAIASGLSRGNGSAPDFGAGSLLIGGGSSDTTINMGNSVGSQNIFLGHGPNTGGHATYIDGNTITLGDFSTNPQIYLDGILNQIGLGFGGDVTTILSQTVNLTGPFFSQTQNLNAFSNSPNALTGSFNVYSNNTTTGTGNLSGNFNIGNNNSSTAWSGYFLIGDEVSNSPPSPVLNPQSANFVGLAGGVNLYNSPVWMNGNGNYTFQALGFTQSIFTSQPPSSLTQALFSVTTTANTTGASAILLNAHDGGNASVSGATTVTLAAATTGNSAATANLEAISTRNGVTSTMNLLCEANGSSSTAVMNIDCHVTSGLGSTINLGSNNLITLNMLGTEINLGTNSGVDNIVIGSTAVASGLSLQAPDINIGTLSTNGSVSIGGSQAAVTIGGHLFTAGPAPTASSLWAIASGSPSIIGNDISGTITWNAVGTVNVSGSGTQNTFFATVTYAHHYQDNNPPNVTFSFTSGGWNWFAFQAAYFYVVPIGTTNNWTGFQLFASIQGGTSFNYGGGTSVGFSYHVMNAGP